MKNIKKFQEYNLSYEMTELLLNSFNLIINESEQEKDYKSVQDQEINKFKSGIKRDLSLNFKLVTTFGAGIGALYPLVDKLISGINPDIDTRTVVLLTIAAVSLIVLEEKKWEKEEDEQELIKETQIILEELKMAGFPNISNGTKRGSDNSILSKVVDIIKSVRNIFFNIKKLIEDSKFSKFLKRSTIAVFGELTDMLAYTGILVPIMNGINYVIGIYNMDVNTFISNVATIISAITLIVTKHGISYLIGRLKDFFDLTEKEKAEIEKQISDIETPLIKKVSDIDGEMIKEQ